MDTTLFLVALVAFSVMVAQLVPRLTGTGVRVGAAGHFVLGVVVGPSVLGLLTHASTDRLQPLLSLLIGVLGFGLGLEAQGRLGARAALLPRLLFGLVVAGLCGAAGYAALLLMTGGVVAAPELLYAAATLGVMAVATSWHRVVEIAKQLRADGPATREVQAFAMTSLVMSVLLFGLITAAMRADVTEGMRQLSALEWLVAIVGVGFVCGVLFVAFIGSEQSQSRVFLATLGTVIFATGMAAGLGISALLVNLVVGATVGAFSNQASRLQEVVSGLNYPTYVLLLILVGTLWTPPPLWLWLLVPLYVLVRAGALRLGAAAVFAAAETRPPSPRFGEGLIAQGSFALAIATSYMQLRPDDGSVLVTVAVAAVLVEDLFADRRLRRVLADAQELYVLDEEPPPTHSAEPELGAAEVHV